MADEMLRLLGEAYSAFNKGDRPAPERREAIDDISRALANDSTDPLARSAYWQGLIQLRFLENITYRIESGDELRTDWGRSLEEQIEDMRSLVEGEVDSFSWLTQAESDRVLERLFTGATKR
jgi:hypothetical protein